MSAAELICRRDLDFLLWDWLGAERVFSRARFVHHSRDSVGAVLDVAERVARDMFLSHYKASDRQEPELTAQGVRVLPQARAAVQAYADAGFTALAVDADLGGLQAPYLVYTAAMSLFQAANAATTGYPMLSGSNAGLIARFGTQAQVEAFALPQIRGEMLGTMCLSEPQAGSSLGDIVARATANGEEALGRRYRITGRKMWISGGDHDITPSIVHLVLAKIHTPGEPLPAGTKGISLFAVPKVLADGSRNDVVVAGLNHKMGYRGTSNCLLNFGEGGGATGYLIGEPGQGLAVMFHMMNEARIGVGLSAAALGYRGFRLAVAYAKERTQGRPAGAPPTSPPVPIAEHPDVRRMLLAQKTYAEGALALILFSAQLVDEAATAETETEREAATALLALLTPVTKTWPSEWGLAANDLAIQVHGGYGYTRDFDVEQLYRDNRLNAIHEGTTGIQGLDLVGRKIPRDGARALSAYAARLEATAAGAARSPDLAQLAGQLRQAWRETEAVISGLGAEGALWNATLFLRAFGHLTLSWLWLDQALAALRRPAGDPLRAGKLAACRYMFAYELPMVTPWLGVVRDQVRVAADVPIDSL